MKRSSIITAMAVSILLCSCSQTENDSKAPAATSAPETTASSQEESSIQTEEIPESDTKTGSLSDDELDRLSNISEDFETAEEFLDSVYVKQYYRERNISDINYIPAHGDNVKLNGLTAYYGCYYIYYTYNDKPMGICVDMMSGAYESAEQIYKETYERLSFTLSDDKEEILSHYRYDKDNDMMICDEKTDTSIGYISKLNNAGLRVEIFTHDTESTIDDIIEFSRQLKF